MSDRRSSVAGSEPASRTRSYPADEAQHPFANLSHTNSAPVGGSSHRRRPSRNNSYSKESTRSTSPSTVDADKGSSKRSKTGRNLLKKHLRRDSVIGGQEESEEENDTLGFVPKLGQIQEGKTSRPQRSRTGSTVSSTADSQPRRRRQTENEDQSRPRLRRKRRSVQLDGESVIGGQSSSLATGGSGFKEESNVSRKSNSTVTQKLYDDHSHSSKRGPPVEMPKPKSSRSSDSSSSEASDVQSTDFQFSHSNISVEHVADEDPLGITMAPVAHPSSSTSDESQEDDESSSDPEETRRVRESPASSPTSMRRPKMDGSVRDHDMSGQARAYRDTKVPLYQSSFVHGHDGQDDEEEEDDDEVEEEEEESEKENRKQQEEDESNEENGSEDHYHREEDTSRYGHPSRKSRRRPPVPRPQSASTSSGKSDAHTRRLRQQERELADHVFKSPRPLKEFQFDSGAHNNMYSSMPMYSPQGSSEVSSDAARDQAQGWPPMPPLPPPLPIAYSPPSTLQSPGARHPLPLSMRPPMGPPEPPVQHAGPSFPQYPTQPPHYQPLLARPDMSKTTVVGYELLADKLSEATKDGTLQKGEVSPMYRKFEHLNHRVLLHLQDEICELEEELRYLDECIAQAAPHHEGGKAYPASRRNDARYGHELHYKRTELLGRIFQKLGQYNQALSSFNNLLNDLDPASPEATQAYRDWIEKREPIDYVETRFLERKHDLLAVSKKAQSVEKLETNMTHRALDTQQLAAVWLPLALILPLMAFAIVPHLIGRLLVIVLIGAAEVKLVLAAPEAKSFMSVREWVVAATVYFGFNVLLATMVR